MKKLTEIKNMRLTVEYDLGHCYFLQCKWEKAIPVIERYIKESTSKSFKAYGAWKLGFCYWMTGRKGDIAELYNGIPSLCHRNKSYDKYAKRKAAQFLKFGGFCKFEEVLLMANNYVETHQFKLALKEVNKIPKILKDNYDGPFAIPDCVGLFRTTKGRLFKEAKKYSKAIPHLEKVLEISSKHRRGNLCRPSLLSTPCRNCHLPKKTRVCQEVHRSSQSFSKRLRL
eukprot:TRINITY_DN20234_c0_g1_i1.p1 TRINITY_DN20234_c0_g1~~TRINITY_DN20234_c0_g1_i1.p1  ORF type:complete len:227 (-),score=19.29 TRINITY_DN20234_c0_g1_i1:399-1079(-)